MTLADVEEVLELTVSVLDAVKVETEAELVAEAEVVTEAVVVAETEEAVVDEESSPSSVHSPSSSVSEESDSSPSSSHSVSSPSSLPPPEAPVEFVESLPVIPPVTPAATNRARASLSVSQDRAVPALLTSGRP